MHMLNVVRAAKRDTLLTQREDGWDELSSINNSIIQNKLSVFEAVPLPASIIAEIQDRVLVP